MYIAFWPEENEKVLVKHVRQGDGDEQKRLKIEERLLKEAATLEEFWSVYFPKIYDIRRKEDDNSLYIISQYFPGCSLREVLNTKNPKILTAEFLATFKSDMLFALDYLHEKKGILHLDLTPDNIIIDLDHKAHIIDFDNSKKKDTKIAAHEIRGKESYLAPLLKMGRDVTLVPEFDHYSLNQIIKEIYASLHWREKIKFQFRHLDKGLLRWAAIAPLCLFIIGLLFVTTPSSNKTAQVNTNTHQKVPTQREPAITQEVKVERAAPKREKITRAPKKIRITKRAKIKVKKTSKKTLPKKKLTFKQEFKRLINTKDKDFKECISFSPKRKKPLTLDFEIEGKTGYLTQVSIKEATNLTNLSRVCLDTVYKELQYPEHKSGKNIIITQTFWITKK